MMQSIGEGFEVLEKDIAYEEQAKKREEVIENENQETREEIDETHQSFSAESFGFVKDKDIAKIHEEKQLERSQNKMEEELTNITIPQKDKGLSKTKLFLVQTIKVVRKIKIKGTLIILIPVGLFLIVTVSYFLFIHATITITVDFELK
jgi:hypothetical protein